MIGTGRSGSENLTSRRLETLDGSLAPCGVVNFDAMTGCSSGPPTDPVDLSGCKAVWVLVRFDGDLLGRIILESPASGPWDLSESVEGQFAQQLSEQRAYLESHGRSQASVRRLQADRAGEEITAVVCTTGDRSSSLRRCLDSLQQQTYGKFRVLVVDNSSAGRARSVFDDFSDDQRFSYVAETRPGLSFARNASVESAETPLIAWCDDDEVADEFWLHELASTFLAMPDVSVVCGYMAPAELKTDAQIWFEQWGGHSKGRGFHQEIFSKGDAQHPLYPLPAFGCGGNMAYRLADIRSIGGFDTALGAGTPAMGAEDTRAFAASMLRGDAMVFHPPAVTFHYHRLDVDEFAAQLRGYGVGLTAFYSSVVASDPKRIGTLLSLLPRALRDLRSADSLRNRSLPGDFPMSIMDENRRGLLRGPIAYVRGRLRNRRFA